MAISPVTVGEWQASAKPGAGKTGLLSTVRDAIIAVLVFGGCLFGSVSAVLAHRFTGSVVAEILAVLRDPGLQWMLMACMALYLCGFIVFQWRSAKREDAGARAKAQLVALVILLLWVCLTYGLQYPAPVPRMDAAVLLFGMLLGQAALFWNQRKNKTQIVIPVIIVLLVLASFWQGDSSVFQYRSHPRWTGPWNNPNLFGLLMGAGLVLSIGCMVRMIPGGCVRMSTVPATRSGSHADWKLLPSRWPWMRHWLSVLFFFGGAVALSVGLVRSYSRGAWVGVAVALCYLGWDLARRVASRWLTGRARFLWPLALVVTGCVLFWGVAHMENRVARRVVSMVNTKDFSWRNRVAAWVGSLQMVSERPWRGHGLSTSERVYDSFYRPPKVAEGMAVQLNDYLTVGAGIGVPALAALAIYFWLGFRRSTGSDGVDVDVAAVDWVPTAGTICKAGAVVLAVGFWFDGGLFKLPTGALFWVLLGLGIGEMRSPERKDEAVEEGEQGEKRIRGVWLKLGMRVWGQRRNLFEKRVWGHSPPLFLVGIGLIFVCVVFWARGRDPFTRHWVSLDAGSGGKVSVVVVLPKTAPEPLPVVLYMHGSGGSILESGNQMRQMAEMGLAVVGLDYDQANEEQSNAQFSALTKWVARQKWADTNRLAWVGFSLGAQRQLGYLLSHTRSAPAALVRLGGGKVPELEQVKPGAVSVAVQVQKPKALLVHGSQDHVFPLPEVETVRSVLGQLGFDATTSIVEERPHDFGEDQAQVFRRVGEWVLLQLKGADAMQSYVSINTFTEGANRKRANKAEDEELASYTRELVNWKVDPALFAAFVLPPAVENDTSRRELWEHLYPRVRKEQSTAVAGEIVVRVLGERITITRGGDVLVPVSETGESSPTDVWRKQVASKSAFEQLTVAAMRSVCIPARVSSGRRAEYYDGTGWRSVPEVRVDWE